MLVVVGVGGIVVVSFSGGIVVSLSGGVGGGTVMVGSSVGCVVGGGACRKDESDCVSPTCWVSCAGLELLVGGGS